MHALTWFFCDAAMAPLATAPLRATAPYPWTEAAVPAPFAQAEQAWGARLAPAPTPFPQWLG